MTYKLYQPCLIIISDEDEMLFLHYKYYNWNHDNPYVCIRDIKEIIVRNITGIIIQENMGWPSGAHLLTEIDQVYNVDK